jgi:hypothetical protein
VSADSPNDIWGIDRNDIVSHYDGTSWSYYTLSGPSGTAFESVAALSPTDVWAAGTNGTTALLEHFNGTAWQVMSLPSSFSGTGIPAAPSSSATPDPQSVLAMACITYNTAKSIASMASSSSTATTKTDTA